MKWLNKSIAALLTVTCIHISTAQNNQELEATNIDADSWSSNLKTGETLFTGNVRMQHGAFLIQAESLTAFKNNDVVEKAIASGSPASFEQQATDELELVRASGNTIEFIDKQGHQSILISQNARLQQGNITAAGSEIKITLEDGVVQHLECTESESQCQFFSKTNTQENSN